MVQGKLTYESVLQAIAECDRMGRPAFLAKYGFKGARDYFLVHKGRNYDSKAIAAVAHKFLPGGKALTPYELIGGQNGAAPMLRSAGFTVATPGENSDWTWDEHVLALELYFNLRGKPFGKGHPDIKALSSLLHSAGERQGLVATEKFRNINGVYMKLMNLRRLDGDIPSKGLERGSSGERGVWDRYANDPPALKAAVHLIRIAWATEVDIHQHDDDIDGSPEGSVVFRTHKARERDFGLVKKKKANVLKATGKLACEVCEMTFGGRYGEHGHGYIEVHHNNPIALSIEGRTTRMGDLACVCANCHRMLHRNGLQTIEWLKLQFRPPSSEQG